MRICEFPLAWRWTDPKYVKLPPEVIAQISPLDEETAGRFHDLWMPCFDKRGEFIPSRFEQIEKCSTEGNWKDDACSREEPRNGQVTEWLRKRETNDNLKVIISWERKIAVCTTWGIFTRQWSDFCYPVSDDAFVVPDDGRWFLAFHHHDAFSFCRRLLS